ncbi:MAG: AcrB/AcrD/AcrF family protein [Allosphingosinicella sp.]
MAGLDRLDRHWRWTVLAFWLVTSALLLASRWASIRGFGLGDTDDNVRIMQVRAWLDGQGWYDLRQYRLNPPYGADIHWSRLVDLPLAGLKLALQPFLGGRDAEKAAVAVAPLLPMLLAFGATALIARRLVAPLAYPLAIAILLCGHSARSMWTPLRIDHHGWQLALLLTAVAGLADPKRARGGAILGLATALSVTIGLEMLLYLALLGGIVVLLWLRDAREARRLATYGGALAGGTALGFLLFASYANRAPVCDALSPVWLSALAAAGAIAVALALLSPRRWQVRLAAAAAAGAGLAAAFAWAWPHCLGRLENVSPEAYALWLGNVREARPIYRHGAATMVVVCALPVAGLVGYAAMLWRARREPPKAIAWAVVAAPAFLAALLLLWQSRAGPAAQVLAVPGATGLAWALLGWTFASRFILVRVLGTVAGFLLVSGIAAQQAADWIPQPRRAPAMKAVDRANGLCPTLWALHPVALVPKGYVLTHVDLGPRLIAVTHHDAVAGPYHRNGRDIVDVMKAFRGTPDFARSVIERRHIDYVLVCPGLSESTVYAAQAKDGFYMQLIKGKVPAWLSPVPLPKQSPYRMWRVVRPGA